MVKQRLLKSPILFTLLVSLAGMGAFLCLLISGSLHVHHDFKFHQDCLYCLWQASSFSLVHEGIPVYSLAAVAFLPLFEPRFLVFARLIRQVSIRAPPYLQN